MDGLGVISNVIAIAIALIQILFGLMLITKNDIFEGVKDSRIPIIGVIIIALADILLIILVLIHHSA